MEITELKERLQKIKAKGFIKALKPEKKKDDGSVGNTLENELEIEENNLPMPDLGMAELKAQRDNVTTLVNLVGKDPIWDLHLDLFPNNRLGKRIRKVYTVVKYGTISKNANRMEYTLTSEINDRGLSVLCEGDKIKIKHIDGSTLCHYDNDDIKEKLLYKFGSLVYVLAKSKKVDGVEYFNYHTAYLYTGVSFEMFLNLIKSGEVKFDFKIGNLENGNPRDRGSIFRCDSDVFTKLYKTKEKIL